MRSLRLSAVVVLLGLLPAASAAVFTYDSGPLNVPIPDDTDTGFASTLNVTDLGSLGEVQVRLELSVPAGSTGWFGDLYAYLRHNTGFAVLLNRPGRTPAATFGYDDSQPIVITLADSATNGDVHGYRTTLGGSPGASLVGPLLGLWAPDGRAIDPGLVWDSSPRNALLGQFAGQSMAGDWTLFVADLSSGGSYRLDRWTLELDTTAVVVPEPGTATAALAVGLLAFCAWRTNRGRFL